MKGEALGDRGLVVPPIEPRARGLAERLREVRASFGRSPAGTLMEVVSFNLPWVGGIEMVPCKEGGQEARESIGGPVMG